MTSPSIRMPKRLVNEDLFAPRLLYGETTQGFLTAKYMPPQERTEQLTSNISQMLLTQIMCVERWTIVLNSELS